MYSVHSVSRDLTGLVKGLAVAQLRTECCIAVDNGEELPER